MANLKISQMTPANPLSGSEVVAGLQDGGNVIITTQDIAGLASPGILKTTKVTITSSELLTLNTNPKTLVSAPGAGKLIVPVTCIVVYKFGTIEYQGGLNLSLSPNSILFNVNYVNLLQGNQNRIMTRTVAATSGIQFNPANAYDNLPLTMGASIAPTNGDGYVDVYLSYYVIDNMN